MSARWLDAAAWVVEAQEAGGRDGYLAAFELISEIGEDVGTSGLPALPDADAGGRFGEPLAVDVDGEAFARVHVGASADHDPITVTVFERRQVEGAAHEEDFFFPQRSRFLATAAEVRLTGFREGC
jgi:hypothetical protein